MKKILNKSSILSNSFILFVVIINFSFGKIDRIEEGNFLKKNNNDNSTIIGIWVSEADNNWKLEFKQDGTCISRYSTTNTVTYNYSISNTTPQCSIVVPVETYTNYLKLINAADTTDVNCYLINGINNTSLSLSIIDDGGTLVFVKQ